MKQTKRTLCTALIAVMLLGLTAMAAGSQATITVDTGVAVQVNGQDFRPKDAKGQDVPIFAYQGTTYAPLRALAEAYGLQVGWDAAKGQAAVSAPAGTAETISNAPNPHTVYYLTNLPIEGQEAMDTSYDFHWLGFEENAALTVKVTDGKLPDGFTIDKDGVLSGRAVKELETTVGVQVSDKGGKTVSTDVLFRFRARGVANIAPVTIYGGVGDYAEAGVVQGAHSFVYLDDDFHTDAGLKDQTSGAPIGTKAGLDALAAYGLTLENVERRSEDGKDVWNDVMVRGELAKGTDGWVKIEVPVYPCYAWGEDGELAMSPSGIPSQDMAVTTGTVEVYLNIVSFAD